MIFAEPGASWRMVGYGPVLCVIVLMTEVGLGGRTHGAVLAVLAAVLAGIAAVQVAAARRHVSVELNRTVLRCGTEIVPVSEIDGVISGYPEPASRILGELSGVPRKREPVGLRLRDGTQVQAWARDDVGFRAAVTTILEERA